jgi:glyoxylase-like metal-dependent hydrolase (beta-lactamase superfamily II)
MSHRILLLCLYFCLLCVVSAPALAYTPTAQRVTQQVYAIIGPLDQRSAENDGLNNNQGFIVTEEGVILIDSGASWLGAEQLAKAVAQVTEQPIRWVINTGSQDHRWLGNAYFAAKGAQIIALERTAATQAKYADQQIANLQNFLGDRLRDTRAQPASRLLKAEPVAEIQLGGETLALRYTDAHYPGDAWVWLPQRSVLFSGDLVYVDRVFAILPWSSAINGQEAFKEMELLKPTYIVPGHGQVCDLAKARRDSGDYYDFLVDAIGAAAQEMEPMDQIIEQYRRLPAFEHLEHFDDLHGANMNRTYLEFEAL